MNTNGQMVSCEDCVYDNKFGSWHCVGCVAKSNFVPRSKRGFADDLTVPEILDVVFNGPATIIFWADGTKTVVKAIYDEFDPEKGLAMVIAKKALGNKGNYFNVIKRWTDEYLEKEDK